MPNGYVYVLMNPALKGQVKIGLTTNSPEERAAELSTTGVPHQFVVVYAELVRDCEKVERLIHEKLADVRVSPNREFFKMTTREAVQTLVGIAESYRVAESGPQAIVQSPHQSHLPDPNDVRDQEIQAQVRLEKRIRRISLIREHERAKGKGAQ
jgi:hypothetical protein